MQPDPTLTAQLEAIRVRGLPEHVAISINDPCDVYKNGNGSCLFNTEETFGLLFGQLNIQFITLIVQSHHVGLRLLQRLRPVLIKNQVCVSFLAEEQNLSPELREQVLWEVAATKRFNRHHICVALNYSSRDEILKAVKRIVADSSRGRLHGTSLSEELFHTYLSAEKFPDPDLIIRTGGQKNFQNALLWQMAYAEFWTSEKSFAELTCYDYICAIEAFQQRERRFGGLIRTT